MCGESSLNQILHTHITRARLHGAPDINLLVTLGTARQFDVADHAAHAQSGKPASTVKVMRLVSRCHQAQMVLPLGARSAVLLLLSEESSS